MDSNWHNRFFTDRGIHFCCPECRKNAELAQRELFDQLFGLALAAAEVCDHYPDAPQTVTLRNALAALDRIDQPEQGPHLCTGTEPEPAAT